MFKRVDVLVSIIEEDEDGEEQEVASMQGEIRLVEVVTGPGLRNCIRGVASRLAEQAEKLHLGLRAGRG